MRDAKRYGAVFVFLDTQRRRGSSEHGEDGAAAPVTLKRNGEAREKERDEGST